ncbi:hypothetical protein CLCR_01363 [Cladophialophora carrionii]|uniref:Uncharacterized protein n=1 Tax=Cladophialophora carrionii TaxID=86049 RepID=A0A1C1CC99_9EURO|nr:hypothetical protein CLCR_01363 [Cladophialophora carrionii]
MPGSVGGAMFGPSHEGFGSFHYSRPSTLGDGPNGPSSFNAEARSAGSYSYQDRMHDLPEQKKEMRRDEAGLRWVLKKLH